MFEPALADCVPDEEVSAPAVGFVGLLNGGNAQVVCARFNAKNSFGAYIGVRPVAYVFRGGRIVGAVSDNPLACEGRSYTPFPELERMA